MLIYGRTSSGKRKPSAKALRLRQERKEFFESVLGDRKRRTTINRMPDLTCESNAAPLSNNLHANGGFKRSVDDFRWKRDRQESVSTINEIERKKTRIAPAWNKGANQYITDGTDPTYLGRKI